MKRIFTYLVLLLLLFYGCEDVYTPELEQRENVIVADARIFVGNDLNYIRLSYSSNFTGDRVTYPEVENASVSLIDNQGSEYPLPEPYTGIFKVNFNLESELQYKIVIRHNGNIYESDFEAVQQQPALDTVYGIPEIKIDKPGGANSVDDFREHEGAQLYTDIDKKGNVRYYRFTSRKIMQFTYVVMISMFGQQVPETMFAWKSYYPREYFNIAAPPEYSTVEDISKHPLYFMEKRGFLQVDQTFAGWIFVLTQHSISESAYNYYRDLNNQIRADGKLFDPIYVQARNNLRCVNDPDNLILGNFEISTVNETRYFVQFISDEIGYVVRKIPFHYDIPVNGEQLAIMPEWWEYYSRSHYP